VTEDEVRAVLDRVTYRPGWTIQVRVPLALDAVSQIHEAVRGGPLLMVDVRGPVRDSNDPEREVLIGQSFPLPPRLRGEEDLLRWLRHALGRVELHERDEWLRVDGATPFDPHAEAARA
jgi:hypothetical protein